MSIISKETWDNLIPEDEKNKIRESYSNLLNALKREQTGFDEHLRLSSIQDRFISLFGKEALQPQLTYEDVARELLGDKQVYWSYDGDILHLHYTKDGGGFDDPALCTSEKQAEKLMAINKLLNVAAYLNKNEDGTPWKPDWKNVEERKYCFFIDHKSNLCIGFDLASLTKLVYFRTEEFAKQAEAILGEDVVRLALTTEY